MKQLLISLVAFFIIFASSAQSYDPSKISKKAVDLYNKGMSRAQDGNLANAAGLWLQAIETDKKYVDAYLSLAGSGMGIKFQEGTNTAKQGVSTLVGGQVTISHKDLEDRMRIYLTIQTPGTGTVGSVYISSLIPSTSTTAGSFTIKSTSATDNSKVAWLIMLH